MNRKTFIIELNEGEQLIVIDEKGPNCISCKSGILDIIESGVELTPNYKIKVLSYRKVINEIILEYVKKTNVKKDLLVALEESIDNVLKNNIDNNKLSNNLNIENIQLMFEIK